MKKPVPTLLIIHSLTCFAFLPNSQAVSPPPDGGYAGGNTAEGQNALRSLTTGTYNTALGSYSLLSDSTGSFNTGAGAGTLLVNIGDENTATGAGALLSNSTGSNNTADGVFALFSNTTASGNTAIGSNALLSNTTGGTLGTTQGIDVGPNTAVGASALASNTTASANTAVGYQALASYTTGVQDTDIGLNTAVGFQTLANVTGPGAFTNDAFGYRALFNLNDGAENVAMGAQALLTMITGNNNVAVGDLAGQNVTTGSNNTCIGGLAGGAITTADNVIAIGAGVVGENISNSCYISNIAGSVVTDQAVFVNVDGRLGTMVSSQRFKEEIKPMDKTSEAILALKPVTFRYKKEIDSSRAPQFGLVAEEVAQVDPDLVVRDKKGEIYSVRYEAVNAMLLNEFLKEHRKVEEQQQEIHSLKTELTEQRDLIQKVTDKLEMRKPLKLVTNDR